MREDLKVLLNVHVSQSTLAKQVRDAAIVVVAAVAAVEAIVATAVGAIVAAIATAVAAEQQHQQ